VADFSENGWQISAITGGKFQREYTPCLAHHRDGAYSARS